MVVRSFGLGGRFQRLGRFPNLEVTRRELTTDE